MNTTDLLSKAITARRLANEAEAKALATPEALEHQRLRALAQAAEAELQAALPKGEQLVEADGYRVGWRPRNTWTYQPDELRHALLSVVGTTVAENVLDACVRSTEAVDKAALEKALKPLGDKVLAEVRSRAGACSTSYSWSVEPLPVVL